MAMYIPAIKKTAESLSPELSGKLECDVRKDQVQTAAAIKVSSTLYQQMAMDDNGEERSDRHSFHWRE